MAQLHLQAFVAGTFVGRAQWTREGEWAEYEAPMLLIVQMEVQAGQERHAPDTALEQVNMVGRLHPRFDACFTYVDLVGWAFTIRGDSNIRMQNDLKLLLYVNEIQKAKLIAAK